MNEKMEGIEYKRTNGGEEGNEGRNEKRKERKRWRR